MKNRTVIERNAAAVREDLERGEEIMIFCRYGRSDGNGNHARAVDDRGRVLGRSCGGGYDLLGAAMWDAVQGVLNVPRCQLTGDSRNRFGTMYANFGDTWGELFGQFGWSVKTREIYRSGLTVCYMATLKMR